MLNEHQIELLPERIYQRLNKVNEETLRLIGERIKAIGALTSADTHRLERLKDIGADVDKITQQLANISGKNVQDICDIYEIVGKNNYQFAEGFYKAKGLEYIPFEENEHLQRYIKASAKTTAETYINMTQTTAFLRRDINTFNKVLTSLAKTYQNVVDFAVTQVQTGVIDYQSAMRSTLKQLADSGLQTYYTPLEGRAGKAVNYATGYSRRLDTAVRQNILWGVKQTNQEIAHMIGEEFGANGYEVSYHSHPRPSHVDMGGRQYSAGDGVRINGTYYPPFSEAEELLKDYGCRHFSYPILLGISSPTYSKNKLQELKNSDNQRVVFEDKKITKYEASQIQRKLETAVRHAKDRANIAKYAGDDTLRRQEQAKINELTSKYSQLSKTANLPTKVERMSVSGYHRVKAT